jgi:glycoside/pentoside/hexuronide:cation symporter, GPH family
VTTEIVDLTAHPNATHPVHARERIGPVEKISYGLGDVAANMSWNFVSGFLLYFYTNVALVPVAALGTLFLFTRVLDAFIDPVVGLLMDGTRSRFGKARPYLLYASIPFGLLSVLTFVSPAVGPMGKIVYAYVTFTVLGIVFSLLNVPYGALMPMMTRDSEQKNQLGSLRALGSSIGSIIVTALTMPLVKAIGHGDEGFGFLMTSIIFAVVSTALTLLVFAACKERHAEVAHARVPLGRAVANLMRNKAWLTTFLVGLCTLIRLGLTIAISIYFCLDILHAPWAISVLLPLISGAMIVSAGLAPPIFKRFGKRAGSLGAIAVAIAAYAAMSRVQGQLAAFIAIYLVAHVAAGVSTTALYTMVADSVDMHEWRFGTRNEGLIYSGFSIATKVGMAVGSAFIAYALAWSGFNPKAPGPVSLHAIQTLYYAGPMVMLALQALCMSFYDMDRRHPLMVAEIQAGSAPGFARR